MTTSPNHPNRSLVGYVMRDYGHTIDTLRNSRESQGVSVRKAAADAGTSGASLSEWERGLHVAQAPALFDLAHALGYDLALIPREDADA